MDNKCEVCEESVARYKCPGCGRQTCSLLCVNVHKQTSGCDGTRDKTKYIAIKKFSDIDLLSDYRFLEDAGRKADGAAREITNGSSNGGHGRHKLTQQCKHRNITLLSMPRAMSRRQQNKSYLQAKSGTICWTVEFVFPQSDAKYTERVFESTLLEDALSKFIHPTDSDPVVRQKLKVYVHPGVKNARIFMKVEGRKADDVRYYELDKDKTLRENFSGKMIIEFPTLFCEPCYCCDGYTVLDNADGENVAEPFCGLVKSVSQNSRPNRSQNRQRWRQRQKRNAESRNNCHSNDLPTGNNVPQNRNTTTSAHVGNPGA